MNVLLLISDISLSSILQLVRFSMLFLMLRNSAVFLLIDGIQQVGDKLMDVVRGVCYHMTKYTKATKLFFIPVISSTISDPFKNPFIWKSSFVRVFLYPHLPI